MDFAGVYVLYPILAVGLPEPYVPSLLPSVMFLPLPLGLELTRSLPHADGASIDLTVQPISKSH
jgi:hypothetical protein